MQHIHILPANLEKYCSCRNFYTLDACEDKIFFTIFIFSPREIWEWKIIPISTCCTRSLNSLRSFLFPFPQNTKFHFASKYSYKVKSIFKLIYTLQSLGSFLFSKFWRSTIDYRKIIIANQKAVGGGAKNQNDERWHLQPSEVAHLYEYTLENARRQFNEFANHSAQKWGSSTFIYHPI